MTQQVLSEREIEAIVAIADYLIPPEYPWPAPSTTEIGRFIRENATREADLNALAAIAEQARGVVKNQTTALEWLALLAEHSGEEFRVLTDFVYLGYYSRPEVVRVIQSEFGCDYISPPQPRGYDLPLDESINPTKRGGFTRTEDVRRVDLSALRRFDGARLLEDDQLDVRAGDQ